MAAVLVCRKLVGTVLYERIYICIYFNQIWNSVKILLVTWVPGFMCCPQSSIWSEKWRNLCSEVRSYKISVKERSILQHITKPILEIYCELSVISLIVFFFTFTHIIQDSINSINYIITRNCPSASECICNIGVYLVFYSSGIFQACAFQVYKFGIFLVDCLPWSGDLSQ